MIKAIKITNHLGESIRLELTRPEKSGFNITNIEGLGPVKANINFTELATKDGAVDNSARLGYRNIIMSLKFLENPTIEDTRLASYKYFPIKRMITFAIETDNRICQTTGRVESNEPDIFSKEEGCQISIMCPDPYFYDIGENGINKVVFYGSEPLFEFPFENADVLDPMIEFGNVLTRTEGNIFYEGDDEIGVTIRIHAVGEAKGLSIFNTGTREVMTINDEKLASLLGSGIQAGDEITITTTKGKKGITMLRGGVLTNILNALDRPISWFQLAKGNNVFVYRANSGQANLQFTIENQVVYEGV